MSTKFLSLLSPIFILFSLRLSQTADTPVLVKTSTGLISGFQRSIRGRPVNHFLGIPFAEAPIGTRRFATPTPKSPWKSVLNANNLSPTCWQYKPTSLERSNEGLGIWFNNTAMSEDCLYLNVWTPKSVTGESRKAVVIWIFGGGFMTGSANLEIYNGAYLASTQDVIVANFQYRVGPFGFLHLPSASASNVGLEDQRLAIQWIVQNVAAFNGDPDRITLVGESAGAASVSMHLLSAQSHRLFRRAILHSGSFLAPWAFADPNLIHQRSRRLAQGVGCLSTSSKVAASTSNADVLKCLRGVPADRLSLLVSSAIKGETSARVVALEERLSYGRQPTAFRFMYDYSFVPVPIPPFFPLNGSEAMARATMKPSDLLVGTNRNEGSFFFLYTLPFLLDALFGNPQKLIDWPSSLSRLQLGPGREAELIARHILPIDWMTKSVVDALAMQYDFPTDGNDSNRSHALGVALERLSSDRFFKCPLFNLASWYANHGHKVFMYSFEHRTEALPMPEWLGTMHGYELDYFFGMPQSERFRSQFYNFTAAEGELSKDMMRRWMNFAKRGDPNSGDGGITESIRWPLYTQQTEALLRFDIESGSKLKVEVSKGKKVKQCRFWDLVVKPLAAKENQCPTPPGTTTASTAVAFYSNGFHLFPCVLGTLIFQPWLHL